MINTAKNDPIEVFKTWIDYWKSKISHSFSYCKAGECIEDYSHGAPVVLAGTERDYEKLEKGNIYYITALCETCNNPNNDEIFEVPENMLAPIKIL